MGRSRRAFPRGSILGIPSRTGRVRRRRHALWRRTLARAKVRPRVPETLRHSCISSLLSRGAPLLYVPQESGHSARVMLASYARWQEQGATTSATQHRNRPGRPRR